MSGVRRAVGAFALALFISSPSLARQTESEVVTEVRVHGNHSIPDAAIVRLARVEPGDAIRPGTLEAIAARLRASDRFDDVDVRKRYLSLAQVDTVALILAVRERPAPARGGRVVRALRTASRQTLVLPILDYAEGHRFTYGARLTWVNVLGERSRLSVPLSMGGTRQVALELDKRFEAGPVHTVRGGVSASRLENQHYGVDDQRVTVWLRAERRIVDVLRVSTSVEWNDVHFGLIDERSGTYRIGVDLDTRRNAAFPRDAVVVQAGWQWLDPGRQAVAISMPQLDVRGFLGLFGRTVLAVRTQYQGASAVVPPYAQPLVGGVAPVRGHRVGSRAGDRLAAASVELRVPLTSPLSFGTVGARLFFDTAATYNVNERLGRSRFSQGAGAGVFLSVAFLTVQLDVARDLRGGTRLHAGTGVSF